MKKSCAREGFGFCENPVKQYHGDGVLCRFVGLDNPIKGWFLLGEGCCSCQTGGDAAPLRRDPFG